jgi:hypothetical protein
MAATPHAATTAFDWPDLERSGGSGEQARRSGVGWRFNQSACREHRA